MGFGLIMLRTAKFSLLYSFFLRMSISVLGNTKVKSINFVFIVKVLSILSRFYIPNMLFIKAKSSFYY